MDFLKAVDIQAPSIDRPFGIHLWPLFDTAFTKVIGYSATDFRFVSGKTPISTLNQSVGLIAAYYATIFGGWFIMRQLPPFKLRFLFQLHNLVLTAISATLLLLFAEQLIPTLYRHGLMYSICNVDGGWTRPMVTLYYLNYLTKYLELLDTMFLVVKKKPLTFLHCYHHGATAFLCYTQLVGETSVSWVVITLNLWVHVVMYWYYFQSARGVRIWWKQWITRFQIIQFVIDLFFVYFASYTYFTSTYWPWMPNMGGCQGEEFAAIAGICVISSYLVLFLSFYAATYKRGGRRATSKAISNGDLAIDPKFTKEVVQSMNGSNGKANGSTNGSAKKNGSVRSRKA